MHDTFLLENISNTLQNLVHEHEIEKITIIEIDVNDTSHVLRDNLYEYLLEHIPNLLHQELMIKVNRKKEVEELTAVIKHIQGTKE